MQQIARTTHRQPRARITMGDQAVDGLLHGLVGGIVMMLFLLAASAFAGFRPAMVLSLFGIESSVQPLNGLLSHLAVSSVYGILWGLVTTAFPRQPSFPGWLRGMVYGTLLYGIAAVLILPTSPLAQIPWIVFLAAHLLYGGTLGLMSQLSLGKRHTAL